MSKRKITYSKDKICLRDRTNPALIAQGQAQPFDRTQIEKPFTFIAPPLLSDVGHPLKVLIRNPINKIYLYQFKMKLHRVRREKIEKGKSS
jgi:hypothetical protein